MFLVSCNYCMCLPRRRVWWRSDSWGDKRISQSAQRWPYYKAHLSIQETQHVTIQTHINWNINFKPWSSRTYRKELMYKNDTRNTSKDVVSMHLAVFETSSRYGDIDYEFDYVTSCVTLTPEGRVPSGKKYNVQIICSVEIAPICDVIIFVSAWNVFQCNSCIACICVCS